MRAKKAGKRLEKVEALLSNVIEQYATSQPHMRELLDSAKDSVVRAKAGLSQAASKNGRKSPVKTKKSRRQSLTTSRKKTTAVKPKGVAAETAPAARKTA